MYMINLAEKLAQFDTHWDPKVVANSGNSGASAAAKDHI